MKKFLAFILALACALSLMACGKKNNDDKPDPDPAPDPQPPSPPPNLPTAM